MIQPWVIWIAIGIICVVLEIFTTSFFFMSIGIGAIIAGLFSLVSPGAPAQIIVFAVISFLSMLMLRKISKKAFDVATDQTNIYGLIGVTGTITKEIDSNGKGYVKIRGEEWSALSLDNQSIPVNTIVIVTAIKGNKLIVKKDHTTEQQ